MVGVGGSVGVDDGGAVGVDVDGGDVVGADGFVKVDAGADVVGGTVDVAAVVSLGAGDEEDDASVAALVGNRTSARLVPCGPPLS